MEIRRLTTCEPQRLRAIRLRALGDAPDTFWRTLEVAASWPLDQWAQQLEELATFVAVVEGRDVGLVRGGHHDSQPQAAELLSLWVAPECRRQGIGEALIDAVIGWAREHGFSRLVLEVGDANAPAITLYARKGFQPTGATSEPPPPRTHLKEHERTLDL